MKQMGKKQYDYQYKFVMVGDSAVGKSSLLLRFADNEFNENYMITIGVDFRFKSVNINNRIIKMQIWDTAGQQRFRTIVNTYYKNAHAVYLIFDLTNKQSFNSIKSYWINEVQSYTDETASIVLIGNKCDCPKVIDQEEIMSFVQEKNLTYFETSAKNSTNVQDMFLGVAKSITENKQTHKGPQISRNQGATRLQPVNAQEKSKSYYQNCQC